ncbi:GPP34 family phosphoprotein [Frigoribacterium sp. VKM Ac-2836]|uniref:GOLPH3/VPS74 family protein n=1 Tax=Frigoribacterium sp. VKM Ac-2836 TaxID=2739014 RepID=UPI0015669548|nr:GPP34 family phosphoprotein [Frigoribacterium sp. VKM Ac-2836]NRD27740.1 GPP34 family phosphoprotein [Frigoribacterium sp. VKM Ac-2836]
MTDETLAPTLAEDLLLVLLDPSSGSIHSEGSPLFHVLAGAVLTELALLGTVDIDRTTTLRGRQVRVTPSPPPSDELLLDTWQRVERKPTDAYSLVLEIGPALRAPTLDRLVARGALLREKTKTLGFIPGTRLRLAEGVGGAGRRGELVASLRSVLAEGAEPSVRTAALAALVSASGALPALHRDIPWSGDVYTRGRELQQGKWGARIAGDAIAVAAAAMLSTSLIVAVGLPGLRDD